MNLWRASEVTPLATQQIRQMQSDYVPAVERLLQESPEAAQWPRTVFLRGIAEGSYVWVAEEGGEVIGMVAARSAGEEAEILNLAVLPQHRRRWLGHSLLECAIVRMRGTGATSVFLEVRETNVSAHAFYKLLGFAEVGRRRQYYRDPIEDAIVLSLSLPTKSQ
jgi:ribosomal-protein-alanine N-acetyltransferase